MSGFKVPRLLAEARDRGPVRVSIEHRTAASLELTERHSGICRGPEVKGVPFSAQCDDDEVRRAVMIVAAQPLTRLGGSGPGTIGIGWDRIVAAKAEELAGFRNPDRFVSLMSTPTHVSGTSHSTWPPGLRRLRAGRRWSLPPAPLLTASGTEAQIILRQRLGRETMVVKQAKDRANASLGRGTKGALILEAGFIMTLEMEALRRARVVANTTGKFFRMSVRWLTRTSMERQRPSR